MEVLKFYLDLIVNRASKSEVFPGLHLQEGTKLADLILMEDVKTGKSNGQKRIVKVIKSTKKRKHPPSVGRQL